MSTPSTSSTGACGERPVPPGPWYLSAADVDTEDATHPGKQERGMVRSWARDVDGYLAEVPEERRDALSGLRGLCRAELEGFDEVMAYGMPV
ncbi:hypothetical protein [Streptomyces sp. ALB3]|uniref:hypothetical protein n=1 Tax=Streptomyces sp. ALB3 TaxID=3374278 RepID=UPI0037B3C18D